ncbi:phage tail family protein [Chengkuizengella sp. SCS-71B]|uniref:phage tail family protein n=1 Tax=Chengkuizengella sp. SCS-71B TaxID=3115290 RepID=UPI0032C219B7
MSEKMIFTNGRGDSIELGQQSPYLLQMIEGLGGNEVEIQTQKAPFQDGSSYIDSLLDERELNFELMILVESPSELFERRRELLNIFNPKLGKGSLQYLYPAGTKELEVVVSQPPIFPDGSGNQGLKYQKVIFSLLSPSPFWTDESTESKPLVAWLGALKFPLSFPTEMGTRGDSGILSNTGDVACPVEIEIKGYTKNPMIKNKTTGQFIKVNREIGYEEILQISTAFGKKKADIIRSDGSIENAFNWINLNSVFWNLAVGENEIEYTSESGENDSIVNVTWKNQYVGV